MNTIAEATIEADPTVPIIRITRDFAATPAQLLRAHTDPEHLRAVGGPELAEHHHRLLGRAHRRQLALRLHPRRPGVRLPRLLPRGRPGPHRADLHLGGHARRCRAGDADVRGPRRRPHPAARAVAGATASRAATPGCAAAWRSGSTRATPSSMGCSPMAPSDPAADRHRPVTPACSPTACVAPATGTAPAPVAGWTARDVVRHLVEWFPGFLAAGSGVQLPPRSVGRRRPGGRLAAPVSTRCRRCSTTRPPPSRVLSQPAHRRGAAGPGDRPLLHRRRVHAHLGPGPRHRPGRPARPGRSAPSCWPAWSRSTSCSAQSGQYGPKVAVPDDADVADQAARLHRPRPGVDPDRVHDVSSVGPLGASGDLRQ